MNVSVAARENEHYYDAFSERYDRGRDLGYHQLIDDQAAELVRRVGAERDVLEVGCGTGLVLERIAAFARSARGIDLSAGMLERARARGLEVERADCAALPFEDASFDVACAFKVLAHVPDFDAAVAEMARVVRPGGHLVFDVYNRTSMRHAIKRVLGPRQTSSRFDESAIETRFWSLEEAREHLPAGTRERHVAGIRVVTPHPAFNRLPLLGPVTRAAEWRLMDTPLARYAGFVVFTLERV